jgi:hypothetical protein
VASLHLDRIVKPGWRIPEMLAYFGEHFGPLGPMEAGYAAWLAESPSFEVAVDRAVRSIKPNGKMHPHQTKVRLASRLQFGERIVMEAPLILRMTTFHDVWQKLDEIKPWGIAEMTVYDVAERIGRFLKLAPDRVYLHAGVRMGAKALGIPVAKKHWLMPEELPEPLRTLPMDAAEDFLCCFHAWLTPEMRT